MTLTLAQLAAIERGELDALAIAALCELLRAWRGGPLVPWTATEYRRHKRDALLRELAAVLAPHAGPATQARRVAAFLSCALVVSRYSTPAERLAAELLDLGEPVPKERQLRGVLSISATRPHFDCRIARDEACSAAHSEQQTNGETNARF